MFDFNSFPFQLSGKTVAYICPKCKYKFDAPIEAVLEFEEDDELSLLKSFNHKLGVYLNPKSTDVTENETVSASGHFDHLPKFAP